MIYIAYKDKRCSAGIQPSWFLDACHTNNICNDIYLQKGYYVSTFLTLPNYGYWLVVVFYLLMALKN